MDNTEVTSSSIMDMLNAVRADKDAKQVFLAMSREDQLLSILGMIAFTNSQIANMQKEHVSYRQERERKEVTHDNKLIDTGEKIAIGIQNVMTEKFGRWTKLADSILDKVITIVIIGILYLVFGGKLP